MMERKFTDNEIIKALECCKDRRCDICLRLHSTPKQERLCRINLLDNVIDLINRQKAEIERLQKYNTDVAYKHYNDGIKEFANRLTDRICNHIEESSENPSGNTYFITDVYADIDTLKKEMTGGDK